ncbi:MAG TPA: hypothetical protein VII91_01160 [Bauldia sp.]
MVARSSEAAIDREALRAAYVRALADEFYTAARSEAADDLAEHADDEYAVAARALARQAGLENLLANATALSLRKELKELEHVQ